MSTPGVSDDPSGRQDVIRERFGAHAKNYALSKSHAKGRSLARLLELTQPERDWRMLDLATGAGHVALTFAPHVAEVVATDITPEMLEVAADLAREREIEGIVFETADAMALPYADGAFDLVTCRLAPHHFSDIGAFVSESVRVLRPGGVLAVNDNIVPEDPEVARFVNTFERTRDPGHHAARSLQAWTELFALHGLRSVRTDSFRKPIKFDGWCHAQSIDPPTRLKLRTMLADAPPAVDAFLNPRQEDGELVFDLHEGLIVGTIGG